MPFILSTLKLILAFFFRFFFVDASIRCRFFLLAPCWQRVIPLLIAFCFRTYLIPFFFLHHTNAGAVVAPT